ncbi:MAG TPA: NAD-dependent epimerase [Nitrospirales bacterium]|nr:NAD-dependent epimerase [Nitrospirales bacterium]
MILVTGAAGFIGAHVSKRLLERGDTVVGLDNVNDYYDPTLKEARLAWLTPFEKFTIHRQDLSDRAAMTALFASGEIRQVVHLAAQAGVRYSLVNPHAYTQSNIEGFLNILESCRHAKVEHLVYASSSSVYGGNTEMPFSVRHNVDHPVSLYAASKKANELMAHTYAHLFNLPCSGLRFFTVYGPWGRPDMALFIFTKAILEDKPIDLFNFGKMRRDFTYIDDIVAGIVHVLDKPAEPDSTWSGDAPKPESSTAPYRLYNIGNHRPVELMRFVEIIEETIGKKAVKNLQPMQPGDVPATYADVKELMEQYCFQPNTPLETGIKRFIEWYREYYKV